MIFKLLGTLEALDKLKTRGNNPKFITFFPPFSFFYVYIRTTDKEHSNTNIFCSYIYYLETLVIKLYYKNEILANLVILRRPYWKTIYCPIILYYNTLFVLYVKE